jgi:hypothetical protein
MYDVLELLLKVKAEGLDSLDKTEGSLKNVTQATKAGSQEFRQFENLLKTLTGAGNTYREAIDQIAKGTSGAAQTLARQIQAADKDFQTFQRNADKFEQRQARSSERQAELAARQAERVERDAARSIAAVERRAAAEERATERIIRALERRSAITSQVNREGELAQERAFALANITNPAQAQRINTAFDAMNAANQKRIAARAARQAEEQAAQLERLGTTGLAYGAGLPMPWLLGRGAMSAGLVGPLVGVGAGVAAVSLIHSQAQSARETKDLSNRLDLPVGQTRDLQNEAKLAGVNVNVLESSVRSLSAALEDDTGSGKKAADAISSLGIQTITSRGEVREMGPVLTEVIDKLSQIPSRTERAHEGTVILGRGYKELEPLIEKHRELNRELDKFGLRSNSNLIKTLDEAETKISAMGIAWDLFKSKLAVAIEPIVIPIVTSVTSLFATPNRGSDPGTPGPAALQRQFDASGRTDRPDWARQIAAYADALNDPRLKSNVNSYSAFLGNQGDQADVLRGRVSKAKEDLDAEIKNGEKFKSSDVDNDARDKERKKIEDLRTAYEKLNAQLTALEGHKRGLTELESLNDRMGRKDLLPVAQMFEERDQIVRHGNLTPAEVAARTSNLYPQAEAELEKQRMARDKENDRILDVGSKDAAKTGPGNQLRAIGLIAGMPASQVNDEHFDEQIKKGLDRHAKDILEAVQKNSTANRAIANINLDEQRAQIEDQSHRTLRNLELGAPVGQNEQRNVIEESYRIRFDLAEKLAQKETERIALETDAEKRREDEANARFAYDKLVWQAEDEHEEKLLQLQHKRIEDSRAVSGKVFDALNQGHGALQNLVHDEMTSIERQVFVNTTSGVFNRAAGAIGGAMPQGGTWNKLFKGTMLEGTGSANASPEVLSRDANTHSLDRLTTAIEKRGSGDSGSSEGSTILSPGAYVPGMIGVTFQDLATFTKSQVDSGDQKPANPPASVSQPNSMGGKDWATWAGLAGLAAAGVNQIANPPGFPGPRVITTSGGVTAGPTPTPSIPDAHTGRASQILTGSIGVGASAFGAINKILNLSGSGKKNSIATPPFIGDSIPGMGSTGDDSGDTAGDQSSTLSFPWYTGARSDSAVVRPGDDAQFGGDAIPAGPSTASSAISGLSKGISGAMSPKGGGIPNIFSDINNGDSASQVTGAIVGAGATAVLGGMEAAKQFSTGGARGIVGGIGATMMTAGTLAGGFSNPVGAALEIGGIAASVIKNLFGDPKQERAQQEQEAITQNKYLAPPTINSTQSVSGMNVAFDKYGHASETSPFMGFNVNQPYQVKDPFTGGYMTVPGSVTNITPQSATPSAASVAASAASSGGSTQVNLTVQALDSQNILDRSADIGQAVYQEINRGGALGLRIQQTVLGS